MKKETLCAAGLAAAFGLCLIGGAQAQDMTAGLRPAFEASAGVGVLGVEAHEYVFSGANHVSFLNWQSVAPVLNASMSVSLPQNWTLTFDAQAGLSGDSHMADYDWTGGYFVDYSFDNWTHRSLHPNTNLDFYFNGSAAIGYDVVADGQNAVNLNGGFKYIDSQWTAYDGTAIYSVGGFRDSSFAIAGKGVTYRQQLPAVFVGADGTFERGEWTFSLGAQAGLTVGGRAIDDHWKRDIHFEDFFHPAPLLAATAGAEYGVSDKVSVFVKGTVDKVFLQRGNTDYYEISTGAYTGTSYDLTGAELLSGTLTAGVKGAF